MILPRVNVLGCAHREDAAGHADGFPLRWRHPLHAV